MLKFNKPKKLFAVFIHCAAALIVGATPAAAANNYPQQAITLVVGYAPGGATDIVARLMAKSLSETLKQPVLVENRSGFGSNIGAEVVARAKPDGYTLLVGSIANTINRALYKKLNYDFQSDFEPVAMLASITNVLVVHPSVPVHSVQDYIAAAKKSPGKLTCASSGNGSSIHMSCELFKMVTGTDILHVPYRGSGPAVVDLLGGQVDSMFDNLPSSLQHVQAGKLRALGVTAPERIAALPAVPTLMESGLSDFSVQSWFAVMAPKGTPPEVIAKLNQAINAALASATMQQSYATNAFMLPTTPNTSARTRDFINTEITKWAQVVKSAHLEMD